MDTNENYVTVVFSKVQDIPALDNLVNTVVSYPIVKRKEQNNGIVAYVVQGILPDTAMPLFREALDDNGMRDVDIVASIGNIFKLVWRNRLSTFCLNGP